MSLQITNFTWKIPTMYIFATIYIFAAMYIFALWGQLIGGRPDWDKILFSGSCNDNLCLFLVPFSFYPVGVSIMDNL